ncbi:hypothetical protein IWZ01DRAFT_541037 [Phyllosticta capitalensis]
MSIPIQDENPTIDPKLLLRGESVLQQSFRPLETQIPTTHATEFPAIHIQKATDTAVNQPLKEPLASLLPTEVATADKNHTTNTPRSGAQIDRASSTEQFTTNSDAIQQSKSPPTFTPAAEPPATHSHGDNSSDQMPFSCDVCGQKFKLKSSKTRHERNFHATGGSTRFGCPVCGKKYARNDGLLAHARKDHGVELPHVSRMTHSHTAAVMLSAPIEHDRNEPNHAFRSVPHEEPALCINTQLLLLHGDVQQSTVTQQHGTVQQQEAAQHDLEDEAFKQCEAVNRDKAVQEVEAEKLQIDQRPQTNIEPTDVSLANVPVTELSQSQNNHVNTTINAQSPDVCLSSPSNTEQPMPSQGIHRPLQPPITINSAAEPPEDTGDYGDQPDNKLPFSCDFCHKKFKLRSSKGRHERSFHVAGGSATFSCPFCEKKFPRNDALIGHARKAHDTELPHVKKSRGPTTTPTSSSALVDQNGNWGDGNVSPKGH